ncbi:MAG: ribonuclease H family protein [Ferrimonas sp.]
MAKFYVVWRGRKAGIYRDWNSCKAQVDGFAGARYKSFPSAAEAEAAFKRVPQATKPTLKEKPKSPPALTQAQLSLRLAEVPLALFCDGACDPNPGKAGTGMVVYHFGELVGCWYGAYNPHGTNNTAELLGLAKAFEYAQTHISDELIHIYSDSSYSIKAITEWAAGWQRRGWQRAGNKPVQNLELIQPLYEQYQQLQGKIQLQHVAGHAGIEGNELADRMSVIAIQQQSRQWQTYDGPLCIDSILALARG